MRKDKKGKPAGKQTNRRLWGVDAIAMGFFAVTALMVQAALGASGSVQAWAVFVAAGAAAMGLGLMLRYTPARQVVILALALVMVIEAVVVVGVTQPGVALANTASGWLARAGSPSAASLARLAAAALFLVYMARPRTARAFRR